jgi:hypothetical protein
VCAPQARAVVSCGVLVKGIDGTLSRRCHALCRPFQQITPVYQSWKIEFSRLPACDRISFTRKLVLVPRLHKGESGSTWPSLSDNREQVVAPAEPASRVQLNRPRAARGKERLWHPQSVSAPPNSAHAIQSRRIGPPRGNCADFEKQAKKHTHVDTTTWGLRR